VFEFVGLVDCPVRSGSSLRSNMIVYVAHLVHVVAEGSLELHD